MPTRHPTFRRKSPNSRARRGHRPIFGGDPGECREMHVTVPRLSHAPRPHERHVNARRVTRLPQSWRRLVYLICLLSARRPRASRTGHRRHLGMRGDGPG
ncbi:hypothetical protein EGJ54_05255 [Pandoraea apista]|nr:hypothetical protein EGJ54_05255 [Pandoraea apista]RRX06820.1 hypothetical protein EGJ56_02565 [Pandoraea apista]